MVFLSIFKKVLGLVKSFADGKIRNFVALTVLDCSFVFK